MSSERHGIIRAPRASFYTSVRQACWRLRFLHSEKKFILLLLLIGACAMQGLGAPSFDDERRAKRELVLARSLHVAGLSPQWQEMRNLDPAVKGFLDQILRIYEEPKLLTNRSVVVGIIGTNSAKRRLLSPEKAESLSYVDELASKGVLARRGWRGEYRYTTGDIPGYWHVALWIFIDSSVDCQSSRLVEGYLNLPLDPGVRQQVHPDPDRANRHEALFARPYAPPLSPTTPQLSFRMRRGCVTDIVLSRIYSYKDVGDEHARD